MSSIETEILHGDLDIPCPRCGYELWARLSEVIVGCTVLCPCCRSRIRLVDDRAAVVTSARNLQSQINSLFREWKL